MFSTSCEVERPDISHFPRLSLTQSVVFSWASSLSGSSVTMFTGFPASLVTMLWCLQPVSRRVTVCICGKSCHFKHESTKVQNPRRNSYAGLTYTSVVYTAHARASASLPRVSSRLYLACFTPVAPVASL